MKKLFKKMNIIDWTFIFSVIAFILAVIVLNVAGGTKMGEYSVNTFNYLVGIFTFSGANRDTANLLISVFIFLSLLVAIVSIIIFIKKRKPRSLLGVFSFLLGTMAIAFGIPFYLINIEPELANVLRLTYALILCTGVVFVLIYVLTIVSLVLSYKMAYKTTVMVQKEVAPKEVEVQKVIKEPVKEKLQKAKDDIYEDEVNEKVDEPVSKEIVVEAPKKLVIEATRVPFINKLKGADDELKAKYNELKAHILSYGIKSRLSINGDTFRLHNEEYIIITIVGKKMKVYYELDPKDYKDSPIPVVDCSHVKKYKDVPCAFSIRSELSIKRAKTLVDDLMTKKGETQKKEPVQKDYVKLAIEEKGN